MSLHENPSSGRIGGVLRDLSAAIGELFGGGKLDPERAVSTEVVFGLLGFLAGADSIVTTHEAEFVNQLMNQLELSNRARDLAHEAFNRGRKREIDVDVEIKRFLSVFPKGSDEVEKLYDALIRLAASDGRLRPGEKAMLEKVTLAFGFPMARLSASLAL